MTNELRSHTIKLVSVGNSKGIRLPRNLLQKYGFSDSLVLEETEQGLLLRKALDDRLSWEDTYRAMALEMVLENEEWNDFNVTLQDGLEEDDFDSKTL